MDGSGMMELEVTEWERTATRGVQGVRERTAIREEWEQVWFSQAYALRKCIIPFRLRIFLLLRRCSFMLKTIDLLLCKTSTAYRSLQTLQQFCRLVVFVQLRPNHSSVFHHGRTKVAS